MNQFIIGQPGQTSGVSYALRQMLTYPYKGLTRRLFLESKAIELMAFQMEYLVSEGNPPGEKPRLMVRYIEKIYQARYILNREMENPPGLFDLAKEVGLTHTRLNQGFHEVFETTVFGYLRSIRLETVHSLLESGEMNVTEAAFTVGYSSLSHFARAFKQHTFRACIRRRIIQPILGQTHAGKRMENYIEAERDIKYNNIVLLVENIIQNSRAYNNYF